MSPLPWRERGAGRRFAGTRRSVACPSGIRRGALVACGALSGSAALLASVAAPAAADRFAGIDVARFPLPTTVETSSGTWASVPMGHLDQRLNTFWQLFFLPQGGSRWSNHAADLGAATNGGIVLAASGSSALLVSIRSSDRLRYSTLLSTSGSGRSWVPGAPIPGPTDGLAAGPVSGELALVARDGGEVLSAASPPPPTSLGRSAPSGSVGSLPSWRTLVTRHQLASSAAGRTCKPSSLTSVAYDRGGTRLVGASCRRSGTVGLFAEAHGTWRLVGPRLPSAERGAQVAVLRLGSGGPVPIGLLAVEASSGVDLLATGPGADPSTPGLSEPLRLGRGARVLSVGADDALGPAGEFALYERSSGTERLAVSAGAGKAWSVLPSPPAGTATVAFGASGLADALSVDSKVMTDWRLAPGTESWTRHQVVHVDILFGSSG